MDVWQWLVRVLRGMAGPTVEPDIPKERRLLGCHKGIALHVVRDDPRPGDVAITAELDWVSSWTDAIGVRRIRTWITIRDTAAGCGCGCGHSCDGDAIGEVRPERLDWSGLFGEPAGGDSEAPARSSPMSSRTIHTCHKDRMQAVHFDTNDINHIEWEIPEELRTKLQHHIEAVPGRGPLNSSIGVGGQHMDGQQTGQGDTLGPSGSGGPWLAARSAASHERSFCRSVSTSDELE